MSAYDVRKTTLTFETIWPYEDALDFSSEMRGAMKSP
jgi:hypothetical protein